MTREGFVYRFVAASVAALVLTVGIFAVSRAAWDYWSITSGRKTIVHTPLGKVPTSWDSILNSTSGMHAIPTGDGVLMVYNSECSNCRRNIENILTLSAELRESGYQGSIVLASVEPIDLQNAWLRNLSVNAFTLARIRNLDALAELVDMSTVPISVIISDDTVTFAERGILNAARRQRLMHQIGVDWSLK